MSELREKLKALFYKPYRFYEDDDEDEINPLYDVNCYRKYVYRERDNGEITINLLLKDETIWHVAVYLPIGGVRTQSDIDDLQMAFNIVKSDLSKILEYVKEDCDILKDMKDTFYDK